MTLPIWHEEPIAKTHQRDTFDCGEEQLNTFLKRYARKNHEMGGSKTFLAISNDDNTTILGFYSLTPASIAYEHTPSVVQRGLSRHDVPVFRLCRLAVDLRFQRMGLGGQLLLAAGKRSLLVAAQVGGVALLIDAKNEHIARWYQSFGAVPLLDKPFSLLLPFKTIHAALLAANKL